MDMTYNMHGKDEKFIQNSCCMLCEEYFIPSRQYKQILCTHH